MEEKINIGKWSAKFDEDKNGKFIMVEGTFPTNGEKPVYHLRRNEPQGINPTELKLTLIPGELADPTGPVEAMVMYSEYTTKEIYETITIVDENHRHIATENVGVLKGQEKELLDAQ